MFKVKINKDKCKGCGLCLIYCPAKNLEFSKGINRHGLVYVECKDQKSCTGCGFCYLMCPEAAIEIIEEDEEEKKKTKKK